MCPICEITACSHPSDIVIDVRNKVLVKCYKNNSKKRKNMLYLFKISDQEVKFNE